MIEWSLGAPVWARRMAIHCLNDGLLSNAFFVVVFFSPELVEWLAAGTGPVAFDGGHGRFGH